MTVFFQKRASTALRQRLFRTLSLTLSLNLMASTVLSSALTTGAAWAGQTGALQAAEGVTPAVQVISQRRPGMAQAGNPRAQVAQATGGLELPTPPAFPFQLGKRALQLQGAVLDALPHVLMALDAQQRGDTLGTYRELETALDTLQAAQLPTGEAGLRLLEAQLPPGYQGQSLVQLYRTSANAAPERLAAGSEGESAPLGGPQGMGSLGAPVPDDAPPPLPAKGEVGESVDQTRYLTDAELAHVRTSIDALVAAFGEDEYPHSELFEQQVAYFIHQYQTELRGFFERSLIRSVKYMPMVKQILAERGVPETMAYIAFVESGFRPNAVSSVGATGLWQFMPKTAKGYGLLIDKTLDERLDPEKATIAAREYFLDLVAIFGSSSFLLAIASYNAGEGKVQYCLKQVENPFTQRTFWDIRPCLRRETREYIPRIIAAAIAAEAPERFGFTRVLEYTDPTRYEVVAIPFSVALVDLAKLAGISVETLKHLNPDLNPKDVATPKAVSSYRLLVPAGRGDAIEAELSAMALKQAEADTKARAEAERKQRPEPTSSPRTPAEPTSGEPAKDDGIRSNPESLPGAPEDVVPGEIQSEDEDIGRTTALDLLEPASESLPATVPAQSSRAQRGSSGTPGVTALAPAPLPREAKGVMLRYRVRPGNSIFQIARDFGKTTQELRIWNPFLQTRGLWPEDVLEIRELPEGSLRIEHQAQEGELIDDIASLLGIPADRIREWNGLRSDILSTDTLLVVYRLGIPPEVEPPAPERGETAKNGGTERDSSVAQGAAPQARAEVRTGAPETRSGAGGATQGAETSSGGVPRELLATLARAQSGRDAGAKMGAPEVKVPKAAGAQPTPAPLAVVPKETPTQPVATKGGAVQKGAEKRSASAREPMGPPAPSPEVLEARARAERKEIESRKTRTTEPEKVAVAHEESGQQATRADRKKARSPKKVPVLQYEVQRGNTLTQIATVFDVTISDIQSWNRLKGDRIRAGQSLVLHLEKPISAQKYVVKRGDTLQKVARKFKLNQDHVRLTNGLSVSEELTKGQVLVLYAPTR